MSTETETETRKTMSFLKTLNGWKTKRFKIGQGNALKIRSTIRYN